MIDKSRKPTAKVAFDAPGGKQIKRPGFLAGEFSVPDNFNSMGKKEIQALFGGVSDNKGK